MPTALLADDADLFKVVQGTSLRRHDCRLLKARPDSLAAAAQVGRPDLILFSLADEAAAAALAALAASEAASSIPIVALDRRPPEAARWKPPRRAAPVEVIAAPRASGRGSSAALEALLESAIGRYLGVNARGPARAQVAVAVRCRSRSGSFAARTKDLSVTGLFLRTPRRLARGERIDLRFSLPAAEGEAASRSGAPAIAATGQVVRLVGTEELDLIPGAGVRFTHIGASDRAALTRFLRGGSRARATARPAPRAAG